METYAKYKGYILRASRKPDGLILIWGSDRNLLKYGFHEDLTDKPITYDKLVEKIELEELYHLHEFGTWHDIEFVINGGTDKTYTLWYSYKDYKENADLIQKCELFAFEKYDRNVYVKSVPKTEITNYRTEKEGLLHK